ncbi:MAG: hypothetical protein FWG05_03065, partial [Kiritimatiellaeota bacterium]|nr:hypothetical protein [Kiritimatiellota bacterium]
IGASNMQVPNNIHGIGFYQGGNSDYSNGSQKFADYLDEFRVAGCARSADWIWAAHKSENADESFTSYQTPTTAGQPLVINFGAASIGIFDADLNCRIIQIGAETPVVPSAVTSYWAYADCVFDEGAWALADGAGFAEAAQDSNDEELYVAPAFGLAPDREYSTRFKASFPGGVEAWSDEVKFTTAGRPWFAGTSATVPELGSVDFNAAIGTCGFGTNLVSCWVGENPEALVRVKEWNDLEEGPTNITHTVSGLQTGGEYFYKFCIYTRFDSANDWTVWSDTQSIITSGDTTWNAGGDDDTRWNTAANWDVGIPGIGATANFVSLASQGLDEVGVTSERDNAVAQLNASGGVFNFDFGENTLEVVEDFLVDAGATLNFDGAALAVTNNAADAELRVGASTGGNTLNIAPGTRLSADALYISYIRDQKDANNNTMTVGAGSVLEFNRIGLAHGRTSTGNKLILDNCAVTNLGYTIMASDWNSGTILDMDNTDFYNAGNFAFGGHECGNSRVWIGTGSRMHVGGNLSMFGTSNNSRFIVSNATLTVSGRLNTDGSIYAGSRVEIHQDPGHTTLFKIDNVGMTAGIFCKQAYGAPIMIYGGALDVAGDMEANAGSNNFVGVIGTNSVFKCRNILLGTYAGTGLGLVVTNGTVNCNGISIGGNNVSTTPSPNHVIVSGPLSRVNANNIVVGQNNAHNHSFTFDGGEIDVATSVTIGNNTSSTNRFYVGHRSSHLTAATLNAKNSSRFVFTIPDDGFENPVFDITGTATVAADTKFHIVADGFTGKATLIAAATVDTEITRDDFTFDLPKNYQGRGIVGADKIEVLISTKPTILIIR